MRVLLILISLLLTSCASGVQQGSELQLQLGMSKAQVVNILGDPQRVSAKEGKEYFVYNIKDDAYNQCMAFAGFATMGIATASCIERMDALSLVFVNGKLDSYQAVEKKDLTISIDSE